MENLLSLDPIGDGEDNKDDNGNNEDDATQAQQVPTTSTTSGRHPDIYANLNPVQLHAIHEEAAADFAQHIELNLPLSHTTRTWIRRGQPVLQQAAFYSKKLAASCMILSSAVTKCPYHFMNAASTVHDLQSGCRKATGVPFQPDKTKVGRVDITHLDRPNRVDSMGRIRPPRPNSYNPNFTLERVMQFFPVAANGVAHLHCGCALEEVLLDFAFWKRTTVVSASTGASEYFAIPLKPRDRLFLCHVLRQLNVTLDFIYEYDTNGKHTSVEQRTLKWVDVINATVVQARKVKAGMSAGPPRRRLEYVDISDEGEGGRRRRDDRKDGRSRRGKREEGRSQRFGGENDRSQNNGNVRVGRADGDDGRTRKADHDNGKSRKIGPEAGRSQRAEGDGGRTRRDEPDSGRSGRGEGGSYRYVAKDARKGQGKGKMKEKDKKGKGIYTATTTATLVTAISCDLLGP
ncbi:hypothetical protein H1R20_g1174, partial [Candolleomyces eurysporus]